MAVVPSPCRAVSRILGVCGLVLAMRPTGVHAQECSTAICVGDPCTISGTHALTDNCDLDFATKTVTVTGTLNSAVPNGSFTIEAGTFTLQQGKLQALGGYIGLEVINDVNLNGLSGNIARININQSG